MSSPSSRSAGRRSAAGNQNQRQLPNRHNRTAAAAARRGADTNSRGTQTEVAGTGIAAPAPTESFDIEQALARLVESDAARAARAAFAAPAPAAPTSRAPTLAQQALAQMQLETDQAFANQQAELDQKDQIFDARAAFAPTSTAAPSERLQRILAQEDEEDAAFRAKIQAQYDSARRKACRQLMRHLEDQTAQVHSIAQLYQKFRQQAAAGSGDELVALPSFEYEEILAQIETDLADLQQLLQQQGGDYDEILGRYRERASVLTKARNEVSAKQEEQEQKKRQKQIDDLIALVSGLQVEMTALREQNTTLAGDVGRLRDQNATLTDDVGRLRDQNAVLSADLVAVRAQVRRLEKQQAGAGAGGGGSDGDQEEEKKDQE